MTDGARAGARKVLVTGGAGFIGSHVADGYLARGDRVWVVDDLSRGKRANVPAGATFVHLSIEDADGLGRLCKEVRFDLVNHHAAQIDVRVSVSDPARDARVNVLGLLNVIEAARRGGVARFVYVSSGGVVYGEPEHRPTPESAPKLPLSPYGVTKLTGEHYLRFYREIQGIEYAALRYSNVYGPRQDPHGEAGVVAIFCNRLLAGKTITVYGDGEQTRDYVHVADVVAANLLVSDARLAPGASLDDVAFNVGTGFETSVNRLADLLVSASGLDVGRVHEEARPGELRHSSLDASRLRALGWQPRMSLEAGLKDTFDWIAADRRAGAPAGA
jgi:UDP-glucose 4-epimerase